MGEKEKTKGLSEREQETVGRKIFIYKATNSCWQNKYSLCGLCIWDNLNYMTSLKKDLS